MFDTLIYSSFLITSKSLLYRIEYYTDCSLFSCFVFKLNTYYIMGFCIMSMYYYSESGCHSNNSFLESAGYSFVIFQP